VSVRGGWVRAILLVVTLLVGAIWLAVVDRESGGLKWLELRGDLVAARVRIEQLSQEAADLQRQIEALEEGGFPLERAIREDLGLARPGEVVFQFGTQRESGRAPHGAARPELRPSDRGE
jgi:cell division protein FtsB